ncbi:MAG: hypothetical protein UU77_C0035G0009 [candidate division WWE3 bacterium GW2011_GWC1_41_7]|jgi:hypothetical protein|uniref:Uncharacterized protein n=3 Tax=Katanobacteria TaxID=422282 RepID=A0A0G1A3K0_UNCKA|nr:MAG: hypothetical protein UU72_C0009G0010 [candidate division WWE3 bacterium GW2011_GWB1_41_6]KKS19958.1 MAG: hypothetical protein UU77_C0035G0009 [candidate division WWE3 bacterium GW2011_GWC1_41_7]KKS22479.1 MAG: hypothetical protein UU80_C0006G0005 [candidate division WWE3 bacterium GW2011_GWA1_41_8]
MKKQRHRYTVVFSSKTWDIIKKVADNEEWSFVAVIEASVIMFYKIYVALKQKKPVIIDGKHILSPFISND